MTTAQSAPMKFVTFLKNGVGFENEIFLLPLQGCSHPEIEVVLLRTP